MQRWNPDLRRTILPLALALLAGCARLPRDLQQVPSVAWQHPERTEVGRLFAEAAPQDASLSGVRLVDEPIFAFRARFGLAALAEKTLDLQYYLWKDDRVGRLLLYRVLEAADRGVRVRLLIDDIYHAGRDAEYAAIDLHPNVELRVFNPIANRGRLRTAKFLLSKRRLNRRMHNKIFLVDGAVAILGGRNIGDDYFGLDDDYDFRDLDVLVVGAAAREAAEAYDLYWNSPRAYPIHVLRDEPAAEEDLQSLRERLDSSLEDLDTLPYVVSLDAAESRQNLVRRRGELIWAPAEVIVDPLERFEGQGLSAFVRFGNEQRDQVEHDLLVQSAYLIPGKPAIANLAAMVDRGVRIRMHTNSLVSNNHVTAHSGYRKYRKRLLRAGVELFELRADAALRSYFQAHDDEAEVHAGLHTKAFVIDGKRSLIGSFNMDPRSRELNSEVGLVVHSKAFAAEVLEHMEEDLRPDNSYRVTLDKRGKLRWEAEGETGPEVYKRDPGAGFWRRLLARVLGWLPIEKEL